eukprot:10778199-Alexandrium_andersonii.AAC.1
MVVETWGIKLPAPHTPHAPHLCGAGDVVRRHMRHIVVVREMWCGRCGAAPHAPHLCGAGDV